MNRRMAVLSGAGFAGLLGLGAGALLWRRRRAARGPAPLAQLSLAEFTDAHPPLTPPEGPLHVYHLGHSLVGPHMPAMLTQLVAGHRYGAQIGWGTTLRAHWEERTSLPGYESINTQPEFADATGAIASGQYDAVVLTEMVELKDAIKWHSSSHYLAKWARHARQARPDLRLYLYETWHSLDDPAGWLERIDSDSDTLWRDEIIRRAMNDPEAGAIYRIPGGPVMAAVARAAEAGDLPDLTRREQLFARNEDGTQDNIHLNDLGTYVIALTHYAVLYQQSPEGLPHRLALADGQPADALSDEAAAIVQRIVWQVVRDDPLSGVA